MRSSVPYDAIVDSIRALGHGDTLTFRAGRYLLPGPLYFRSHVLIRGEMRGRTKLVTLVRHPDFRGPVDPEKPRHCWNETYQHWETQKGPYVETLIGACTGPAFLESLTLQDLRVEGFPEDADIPEREQPFDLIRMAGNRVVVRNLEVRHSRNGGILLFGGEGNVIENCTVENTARDGIFAGGFRDIVIRRNVLRANRDNSIAFDCQNVAVGMKGSRLNFVDCGEGSVISGNTIDNGRTNPLFKYWRDGTVVGYNSYGWSTSGTDKDRSVYASGGIYVGRPRDERDTNGVLAKVKGVTVENNRILDSWLWGIRLDNGCENITIRGNIVSAPKLRLYAIGIDADDGTYYPRNIRITGNSIFTSSSPKVFLKRNREVWFAGNFTSSKPSRRLALREIKGIGVDSCQAVPTAKARMDGHDVEALCP